MTTDTSLRSLTQQFTRTGRLEGIYVRTSRRGPVTSVSEARVELGRGLIGDHRSEKQRSGDDARKRELTLIQAEHIELLAGWLGQGDIDPARLRRNLVVSGINLIAMRSSFPDMTLEWRLGDEVRIVVTGPCAPCSRMEEELGTGGYNAMRGHGGVTARLTVPGTVRVGDAVRLVARE